MNKVTVGLLLCFMVSFLTPILKAQEFEITHVELAGDKMLIFYDLLDTTTNRTYTIHVYSSLDSFIDPLENVSGDEGLEVRPGTNKKITWEIAKELGPEFKGKISLEVRGRLYVPFVRFTNFQDYGVIKRGRPFVITWDGGTRQNVLNFDLYQGETLVWTQPDVANTGDYEMTIPTSVKPGKNYKFKVSDTKNSDQIVYTDDFEVKRKVALGVKVIPVVVVAGALIATWPTTEPQPATVADAPCPDGGNECNN